MKVDEEVYYSSSSSRIVQMSSKKPKVMKKEPAVHFTPISVGPTHYTVSELGSPVLLTGRCDKPNKSAKGNITGKHFSLNEPSDKKKSSNGKENDVDINKNLTSRPGKIVNSTKVLNNNSVHKKVFTEKDIALFDMRIKKEEKIQTFTNTEEILDFYEYTENCLKMILKLPSKPKTPTTINLSEIRNNSNKKLAVFDIDETLIHCTGTIKNNEVNSYQHVIDVMLPSKVKVKVGINIRPHWQECLDLIKNDYHIITYTASHSSYANSVLDYLDPENKYFEYRLYRNHCVQVEVEGKKFYVKDLDILSGFDLKNVVIIDNSVLSFSYHLSNGIPIVPYYESENDTEMIMLGYYLLMITKYDDLRDANIKHIRLTYILSQTRNGNGNEELSDEENYTDSDEEEEKQDKVEERIKAFEAFLRPKRKKATKIGLELRSIMKSLHSTVPSKKK